MRETPMHDEPPPRFPVEQWRLANGLRVVVQTDSAAPLVALVMCYGAGSRRDPVSRSGLAHLCEHLAFQGPELAGGFPARIENAGGSTQAYTMTDRLCFSAMFPRRELATVLAVEAERMARPLQPQDREALEIQRRVLLEELRERSQHRIRAAAFEQIHRLLFPPEHPYHRPPVGEPEGIRAVTAEDVESFAAAHFSPDNAVLVLVGDLSVPATAELVHRLFAGLPAGRERAPEAAPEASLPPGVRQRSVPAAVTQAQAHVAWTVPGFGQDGWYLASLLMRGLAVGRSSPLARELVEQAGLAQEVHGYLVTMRDASTLVFAATAARGVDGHRLEQGLLAAADLLLSRGLSASGMARARRKALSDHYFAAQSFDWRADLCASLACYLATPERLEEEPRRYLGPDQDAIAGFAGRLRQAPSRAVLSFAPAREAA
ncbi:MAG: pitrilysin family protein [Thermoanaerobaculia bacterium]